MRIAICWMELSGYMAACWRALAACDGVELLVLAQRAGGTTQTNPFAAELVAGLNCHVLDTDAARDAGAVARRVTDFRPDLLIISGWAQPSYVALARRPELANTPILMAMDTPWRGTWRQHLGRHRLRPLVRRLAGAVVAGERSRQLALHLGVPAGRVFTGVYGFDGPLFDPCHDRRLTSHPDWPRRFLYMGRYVEAKGLDVLLAAYQAYRGAVTNPWPLSCFGHGPLHDSLRGADGVEVNGFVQPPDQPPVLAAHGAFILPSRYEPWGVAVAEAMAAGLPVICTDAVGASVELLRPLHNGLTVPPDDPPALARALRWVHDHADRLPAMGLAARATAAAYRAEVWAARVLRVAAEVTAPP
jgi:glycosyltransferase involved in cell wall biosynthesis